VLSIWKSTCITTIVSIFYLRCCGNVWLYANTKLLLKSGPSPLLNNKQMSASCWPLNLQILFLNSKKCLLIGFYTKMDLLVSQLSLTRLNCTLKKFIHWVTRGRLNNHCNNKGLLGMKWRRMATGFLHSSAILTWSAIFDYMGAVYNCTHH